ncbi:D-threonate kinase [Martelella alba]|uniref:Four-carbon acid sugar kinase family protein n=1 Tax=Martelella alba TaxID=2590451 RepID=A0ABY2SDX1_9HYPH|nr:four-carbon acid sugar kinase family protein [Martelella alba]TKI02812.1 four-carbon acid sugar kinase family protein [Martelella alba]
MGQWETPLWVLADDFTGANDIGGALARTGARVHVLFDARRTAKDVGADVQIINTDSRALPARQAAQRVKTALAGWRELGGECWLFKKIDSTLRGNLGAELDAALAATGATLAIVAPAVPRLGRTTRNGQCYIHGRPLAETEYASDPKTPIRHSGVIERCHEQSVLPMGVIDLTRVRDEGLAAVLADAAASGRRMLVVDAENDGDLARIVRAPGALATRPILVGAAGLGDALARELNPKPASPVLAVIGSMSHNAQRQIACLRNQYDVALVDIDVEQILGDAAHSGDERGREQAIFALRRGQHCLIRTCQSTEQRSQIEQLCARYGLTRQTLGETLCASLAELTAAVCRQAPPAGLFLSGGDVAMAVARGMGATGFRIEGQIAGCVPWGHLLNGAQGLRVMTKAGGFGDEHILVEVIRFIEETSSE